MKRVALSVLFCLVSASAAFPQTKSPVEGVWSVSEVVVPGRNPAEKSTTVTNPQPGLMIFTRGHYSELIVIGQQPRAGVAPPKDPQNLTDIEKIARYEEWRRVIATAGTYEVKGSTLLIRPIVTKSVEMMTSEKPIELTFKLEGSNTLWLVLATSATELRTKLTRLE